MKAALRIIDEDLDLRKWEGTKFLSRRRKLLRNLRQKITSQQTLKRKFQKRFRNFSDWEIGSVIAYRLISDYHILFKIIDFHIDWGGTTPIVEVLDWVGSEIPPHNEIKRLKRKVFYMNDPTQGFEALGIGRLKESELPYSRVSLVMKGKRKRNKLPWAITLWRNLDDFLSKYLEIE